MSGTSEPFLPPRRSISWQEKLVTWSRTWRNYKHGELTPLTGVKFRTLSYPLNNANLICRVFVNFHVELATQPTPPTYPPQQICRPYEGRPQWVFISPEKSGPAIYRPFIGAGLGLGLG